MEAGRRPPKYSAQINTALSCKFYCLNLLARFDKLYPRTLKNCDSRRPNWKKNVRSVGQNKKKKIETPRRKQHAEPRQWDPLKTLKNLACERQTFLLAHRRWGTFRSLHAIPLKKKSAFWCPVITNETTMKWMILSFEKNHILASIILGSWRESDSRETRFAFRRMVMKW